MTISRQFVTIPLLAAALALGGCASTGAPDEPQGALPVVEEYGFTITEPVEVGEDERFDYDRALALIEQGRIRDGIAVLEPLTQRSPGLSAPLIDLGVAYHRLDDLERAESSLRAALELNPDHPAALNELGIILRKQGRFDEAKTSYETALAVFPGYHYARRNLAILCDLYFADLSCALEQYEAYMETVPGDKEAEVWIADIRARLGR